MQKLAMNLMAGRAITLVFTFVFAIMALVYFKMDNFSKRPTEKQTKHYASFKVERLQACAKDNKPSLAVCTCLMDNAEKFAPLEENKRLKDIYWDKSVSFNYLRSITDEQLEDAYFRGVYSRFTGSLRTRKPSDKSSLVQYNDFRSELSMRTAKAVAKGCKYTKDFERGKNLYNSGILNSQTEENVSRVHKLAQHRLSLHLKTDANPLPNASLADLRH